MSDDPTRSRPDDEPSEAGVPPSDPPYDEPHPPGMEGPATGQADPPPGAQPVADPPAPERPAAPDQPPPGPPPASGPPPPSLGERWAAPQAPPPGPATPAPGAGFSSGDPLGGSVTPGFTRGDPAGAAPYPGGYTTPPPPGAGGHAYPPAGPEPVAGRYVLSGWWRRVGAAVIDGFIILVLAVVIMAPLGVGFFSLEGEDTVGFFALVGAFLLGMLIIAVVGLAYAPVMMSQTNGKTVGRMATGIRVVRANGQPMTFGWAALREVAVKALLINAVAGSFTFGLAGLIDVLWPLWDDENRALHDFVVDTRTVID